MIIEDMNHLKEHIKACITGEENLKAIDSIFEYYKYSKNGIVVEIEDYDGNSIGSIQLNGMLFDTKAQKEDGELNVADFDEDYIYDTNSELIRIQINGELRNMKEILHEKWYLLNKKCQTKSRTDLFFEEQDLVVVEYNETEPYMMDKQEILHMLINNNMIDYCILAENCIKIFFDTKNYYIICPILAEKRIQTDFNEIKNLLG